MSLEAFDKVQDTDEAVWETISESVMKKGSSRDAITSKKPFAILAEMKLKKDDIEWGVSKWDTYESGWPQINASQLHIITSVGVC